jgi:hypothetical protein
MISEAALNGRATAGAGPAAEWTCPNCSARVSTGYCPACGEGRLSPKDLTLRGLLDHLLGAFSSVDGRLIRSFRSLLQSPGSLTVAYLQGRRVPFTTPFRIFLFANMLFFLTQSLTNASIVSETLESHLHDQDWSSVAQRLVDRRLDGLGTTLDRYAPAFDKAVRLNAKSLIILMVVPFTLFLAAAYPADRRPFMAHAIFALHFYAFELLLLCCLLGISGLSLFFGGSGIEQLDKPLFVLMLTVTAAYLYLATGAVYASRGGVRLTKVIALSLTVGALLSGYRFLIFLVTLYTTKS